MKKVLLALGLLIIVGVCLADPPPPPQPPAWVVFERTGETTGTILWSREPSANVDYYFLAVYPTTNRFGPLAYCDPVWSGATDGWANSIPEESPGVLKRDVVGLDPLKDYDAYVAAVGQCMVGIGQHCHPGIVLLAHRHLITPWEWQQTCPEVIRLLVQLQT